MGRWLVLTFAACFGSAVRPVEESAVWLGMMGFAMCMAIAHWFANLAKGGDRHG